MRGLAIHEICGEARERAGILAHEHRVVAPRMRVVHDRSARFVRENCGAALAERRLGVGRSVRVFTLNGDEESAGSRLAGIDRHG